ncbi:CD225/dispanin family protein [Ornithobacterium rhinotracheale]|uniref:CD225/dispanin family protein n=1 Tax=Ornithobacterium rhinotracheale TaxID=28251 RepID=UPI00129C50FE|nr:CD225/dispanin family protein [Ornithobacterium rhinotracheale]MRJ09517.1 CD225/dispanin family protein [Ornithobacterium rhinotracheale]
MEGKEISRFNPISEDRAFNEQTPENYLVWAILSTCFCCLPLGVVSIVKSLEVSSKWEAGNYEGARKSSEDAKKWAIYSALSVTIIYFLILMFYLILAISK